jgi:hypothetical protein
MMNSDYDKFEEGLSELASCYLRKVDGDEIAAYFKQLSRYPIEAVLKAMAGAPKLYSTYLATASQLIEICDGIVAAERPQVDAVTLIRAVEECEHEDRFEPEPEGGLYAGFDVCSRCGRAKPRINQGAPPIQLEYFRMAMKPKEREQDGQIQDHRTFVRY